MPLSYHRRRLLRIKCLKRLMLNYNNNIIIITAYSLSRPILLLYIAFFLFKLCNLARLS